MHLLLPYNLLFLLLQPEWFLLFNCCPESWSSIHSAISLSARFLCRHLRQCICNALRFWLQFYHLHKLCKSFPFVGLRRRHFIPKHHQSSSTLDSDKSWKNKRTATVRNQLDFTESPDKRSANSCQNNASQVKCKICSAPGRNTINSTHNRLLKISDLPE